MTLSAMMMALAIWKVLTDLENEVMAIWIRSMGSTAKEERQVKRRSQESMNPFKVEAHPGEAIGNTYVSPKTGRQK